MTAFQQTALLLILIWLLLVVARFRRSRIVIVGGLIAIALYTLVAFALGKVTFSDLGLSAPKSWLLSIGLAVLWFGLMLAYSPVADRLAARWFRRPPTLDAFRAIRRSKANLVAGIIVAWVLGGFLEELVARGIVLKSVQAFLAASLSGPFAAAVAVCVAAIGAGLFHLYQGPRAVVIIAQLSVLFGILFVITGYNLWAVIFCHGLYDTVAFVRFASGKSRYSKLDRQPPAPG